MRFRWPSIVRAATLAPKLNGPRLNDDTRFRRLGDVNVCLVSKCGNNSQERGPLALLQRFVKRIRDIIRFRRALFFGVE